MTPTTRGSSCSRRLACYAAAAFCFGPLSVPLEAQSDNFDDGDDAGWTRSYSPSYPATYSFPGDLTGGHAYRLQAAGGSVVAYRADRLYTNFFVAADMLAWDTSQTNALVFGLIGRGNNLTAGIGDAATLTTRLDRYAASEGNKSQFSIYSFFFGDSAAPAAQDLGSTMVPGRHYRFTMTGVGTNYWASVYDLEDLTYPLVTMYGDDSYGPDTFPDYGYSGVFALSYHKVSYVDATFDNFYASESPPTAVAAPATPHGLAGAPQVVNRTPVSFANFHPAASGISFLATTLTTTNAISTGAIALYLNGVNVSSGLSLSGPTTNVLVSYNGLTSNLVYDARIELQDALGRRTTNVFTFDTFTDAYLVSTSVKNIECEDYDYTDFANNINGLFIDDPLASGVTTNGSYVNTSGGGYYGLNGASTVDFYNSSGSVDADFSEFRTDPIPTLQGNKNFLYITNNGNIVNDRTYEHQRQKYINADPGLEEYEVVRTRGGMWLNYTRFFPTNVYYNVYLRHACAFSQSLRLDQILAGPVTNNLGTFYATNALWVNHYRYAPLRDSSGKPAVVNLSGTNTVRLTVSGTDGNPTRYGLSLNYMAFVPALLVESAAQVNGLYSVESSAAIEPITRQITLTQGAAPRFYRLRWDHAARITSITLGGGNVVLGYQ